VTVLADLAFAFGWQPSELKRLRVDELLTWHDEALRLHGKADG
jgi:hypothetical protein